MQFGKEKEQIMEHKLTVEALKDGTVIDHIPAGQGRRIAKLLRLSESGERVYMGFNLPSQRSGKKDLVKVANILLSEEDANKLALYAPSATVNIIKNFEVVKKHTLGIPESIDGILTCPNSNCISRSEAVQSSFYVTERQGEVRLKCFYCEKAYTKEVFTGLA